MQRLNLSDHEAEGLPRLVVFGVVGNQQDRIIRNLVTHVTMYGCFAHVHLLRNNIYGQTFLQLRGAT